MVLAARGAPNLIKIIVLAARGAPQFENYKFLWPERDPKVIPVSSKRILGFWQPLQAPGK